METHETETKILRKEDSKISVRSVTSSSLESNRLTHQQRVQIKETTEVNGVRFPSGIQIDVTEEDAKRMIEGDKAIMLEDTKENENTEKNKEKEE